MEPSIELREFAERLRSADGANEVMGALFISPDQQITGTFIREGDFDRVSLPTAQIIEQSLSSAARQIILLHIHPSGDPRPSRHDILATKRLRAGLRPHKIHLCDHLILTRNRYFSFRHQGLL